MSGAGDSEQATNVRDVPESFQMRMSLGGRQ